MSYSYSHERSLFSYDDFVDVHKTHHPFIYDLTADDLRGLRKTLKDRQDKERTHARQRRREMRGKADERGGSIPGAYEHPQRRKQVLGAAVKRVNAELSRRRKVEAKTAHMEAAAEALAMVRNAKFRSHPGAGETPSEGMTSLPSRRRKQAVHGAKIGSISQMNKVSQAIRDGRG